MPSTMERSVAFSMADIRNKCPPRRMDIPALILAHALAMTDGEPHA